MSSNRQIVKAARRAATSANAAALTRAVVKAAAPRVVQSVTSVLKSKNSANKVNRTRGGQRPIFDTEDHWTSQITTPVAYTARWGSGSRPLRVKQSEMVGAIKKDGSWWPFGENGFQVKKFQINPADSTTFPWLSNIAKLFDKYRFHSLTFRYVNTTSTIRQGTFMMGVDYDTLDSPPTSEVAFSQLAKYSAGPVFQPHSMAIPVSHPGNATWLYTYDLNTSTNDPKTYNLGNVFIGLAATESSWNSGTAGYLFVDYDVEFLDKNPAPSVSKKDDDDEPPVDPDVQPGANGTAYRAVGGYNTDNNTFAWETEGIGADCVTCDGTNFSLTNNTGHAIPAGSTVVISTLQEFDKTIVNPSNSIISHFLQGDQVRKALSGGGIQCWFCSYEVTMDIPQNTMFWATEWEFEESSDTMERNAINVAIFVPSAN